MDDFQGRDGLMYFEEKDFSETWLVGTQSCQPVTKNKNTDLCSQNPTYRQHAKRDCGVLYSSFFASCHRKIDAHPFYQCVYLLSHHSDSTCLYQLLCFKTTQSICKCH